MRHILLTSGAIILLTAICVIILLRDKTDVAKSSFSLACKGDVHFYIQQPDATATMDGNLSLTTLGNKRLALGFSGKLHTDKGSFTLSRTLMMDYIYHPENNILELNYAASHATNVDTAPEDVFFHALLKGRLFILKLSRLSDNTLLISDATTPLYACVHQ